VSVLVPETSRRHDPIRYDTGASFRLAWSAPARVETGMTEFVTVQGVACLRDDYRGFVEVGREPITDRDYRPWPRIDFPFDTDQFFANGDLAITTSDLDVFRWRPGEIPTRWWAVPAAAATTTNRSLTVRPLDDDLVLVQDYGQRRQTTLCRRTSDVPSWLWQTTLSWSLRLDDHLVAVRTDRRGWVVSNERATGREEWARELAGDIKSLDIVGVGDGVMWFVGRGGLLAGEPVNGKTIREIRTPYRGLGTLELPGTYHICSPGYYCEDDLRNGGKPIVEIE